MNPAEKSKSKTENSPALVLVDRLARCLSRLRENRREYLLLEIEEEELTAALTPYVPTGTDCDFLVYSGGLAHLNLYRSIDPAGDLTCSSSELGSPEKFAWLTPETEPEATPPHGDVAPLPHNGTPGLTLVVAHLKSGKPA